MRFILALGHDTPAVTIEMYYTTYDHVQQASTELALASIYGLPTEPKRLAKPFFAPLLQAPQRERDSNTG
jgi:hypothetical protein